MNDGQIPLSCFDFTALIICAPADAVTLSWLITRSHPVLMILVTHSFHTMTTAKCLYWKKAYNLQKVIWPGLSLKPRHYRYLNGLNNIQVYCVNTQIKQPLHYIMQVWYENDNSACEAHFLREAFLKCDQEQWLNSMREQSQQT